LFEGSQPSPACPAGKEKFQDDDANGALVEWYRNIITKISVPLCSPRILHAFGRDRNRGERPSINRLSHGTELFYPVLPNFRKRTAFLKFPKLAPPPVILARATQKCSGENLFQCRFVHHKYHRAWPAIAHGPAWRNRLSHGRALKATINLHYI